MRDANKYLRMVAHSLLCNATPKKDGGFSVKSTYVRRLDRALSAAEESSQRLCSECHAIDSHKCEACHGAAVR